MRLTSPIKTAQTGGATVTTSTLDMGQVAIFDDGSGRLGVKGRIGRTAVLEAPRPPVPLTLVTGPGYFAAPRGAIDPETDRMVFYTMGCRTRSIDQDTGEARHGTKKRYSRMGLTTASQSITTIWTDKQPVKDAVEAALTLSATIPENATTDFFTADLAELEEELLRKFYIAAPGSNDATLCLRIGNRRKKCVKYGSTMPEADAAVACFSLGVAVERGDRLITDICPVRVKIYNGVTAAASSVTVFARQWFNSIVGKNLKFAYSPVRLHGVPWQRPGT